MRSKQDVRKQLEAGLSVFFGNGGSITKVPSQKPRGQRSSQPKEKIVEIEVDYLPKALQNKYFAE